MTKQFCGETIGRANGGKIGRGNDRKREEEETAWTGRQKQAPSCLQAEARKSRQVQAYFELGHSGSKRERSY